MNKYTQADNAAFASMWCPEPGRPFKYEVRKAHYNYDEKRWNFEVYKQIEGSYAIEISWEGDASQGTAEGLLEMAKLSGDVIGYFEIRKDIKRAQLKLIEDAKQKIKQAESNAYWAQRQELLAAVVAECDAEIEQRKQKQRAY